MLLGRFRHATRGVVPFAAAAFLAGCVDHNQIAMRVGAAPLNAVELREVQTARFDADNEVLLLTEATQVLQDLGFGVAESAPQIGVLTGHKARDATEAGEVAAQIALTVVAAAFLVAYSPTWDENQVIRVTLTTQPIPQSRQTQMRASFERMVVNNKGMRRVEVLNQPEMHQEFFNMLRNGMAMRGNRT